MTSLALHPQQDDEATAETMLYEARIALALLQRYAPEMPHVDEGRIYLTLIHDACTHAAEWASAHLTDRSRTFHPAGKGTRSAPAASIDDARPNNRKGESGE